ncbi:MAG: Efflux ABC transporter, permease/ATP-binding protein, partial [uncultured Gemmatimonadetes bacterium]
GPGTIARRTAAPVAVGRSAVAGRAVARHAQRSAVPAHGVAHPPRLRAGHRRAAAGAGLRAAGLAVGGQADRGPGGGGHARRRARLGPHRRAGGPGVRHRGRGRGGGAHGNAAGKPAGRPVQQPHERAADGARRRAGPSALRGSRLLRPPGARPPADGGAHRPAQPALRPGAGRAHPAHPHGDAARLFTASLRAARGHRAPVVPGRDPLCRAGLLAALPVDARAAEAGLLPHDRRVGQDGQGGQALRPVAVPDRAVPKPGRRVLRGQPPPGHPPLARQHRPHPAFDHRILRGVRHNRVPHRPGPADAGRPDAAGGHLFALARPDPADAALHDGAVRAGAVPGRPLRLPSAAAVHPPDRRVAPLPRSHPRGVRVPRRLVPLPGRGGGRRHRSARRRSLLGAAGRVVPHSPRGAAGAGGGERRGKDDRHQAAHPAVRAHPRRGTARWPPAGRLRPGGPARPGGGDLPGLRAVRHDGGREHRRGPHRRPGARSGHGPAAGGGGGAALAGLGGGGGASRALRADAGAALRGRGRPVGRAVAEGGAGPGLHARRPAADPGRAHRRPRRARRVRGVPAVFGADGGEDGRPDLAPLFHGADGRPHRGAGARARAGGGDPRGAAGPGRPLRRAVQPAGRGVSL